MEIEYLVQVGKNKSAYRTRYSFKDNLNQAAFYYACINVGRGYKKRLVAKGITQQVLARQYS